VLAVEDEAQVVWLRRLRRNARVVVEGSSWTDGSLPEIATLTHADASVAAQDVEGSSWTSTFLRNSTLPEGATLMDDASLVAQALDSSLADQAHWREPEEVGCTGALLDADAIQNSIRYFHADAVMSGIPQPQVVEGSLAALVVQQMAEGRDILPA